MQCPTHSELPPPPPGKSGWPWTVEGPPWRVSQVATTPDASWPKFTIVTPAYNSAAYLEETIRSVLLQGYPNLEYMVVDGGSQDGTAAIIHRYAPWLTFWCSEPDRGQSHALNKGFARATGDWLAWLNADDIYLPNALYQVATAAHHHPASQWIVGVLRWMDIQGIDYGATAPTPFAAISNPEQWHGSHWLAQVCFRGSSLFCPQPTSFWSHHAHMAVGPVDETLHYAMDLDLWGRLAYAHFAPTLIAAELASFRLHDAQKSATGDLRFMTDELAIVDKWLLRDLAAQEDQTLQKYRHFLHGLMVLEQQMVQLRDKQQRWQALMRNPYYHGLFTLARKFFHSTHLSRELLRQLNKHRPAWMYFYG